MCIQMDKVLYDVNGRLVDEKEYEYLMEIDKRDKVIRELLHEQDIRNDSKGTTRDNGD